MHINIGELYDELRKLHFETLELERLERVAGQEKIRVQSEYVERLRKQNFGIDE